MGRARALWERLCFAESNPFARFEDGLQVPLDYVLPTPSTRALLQRFEGAGVIDADPLAASGWGFAADRFLESGRAQPGARVISSDPHVLGLGALGIPAAFHTPAVLWTRWAEGHDRVGLPRQTLVQVNGPLAPGTGPADIALHLARESAGIGFAGAILEFRGEGIRAQPIPHRRVLCALSQWTGCLTALGPLDRSVLGYFSAHGLPPPMPATEDAPEAGEAPFDELVVVNGDRLEPLAGMPRRGWVRPVRELAGKPVRRVVIGGCVGGDWDSLEEVAAKLRNERVEAQVELLIVPATEAIYERFADTASRRALDASGARLCRPHEVPLTSEVPTLATTTCLAPDAITAGPDVCLSSAIRGRFAGPLGVIG